MPMCSVPGTRRDRAWPCSVAFTQRASFSSFSALAKSVSDSLPNVRAVIDGEICSLDRRGRPQFKNLMFRRNPPCFFAFDMLTCDGKDLRTERLLDRKQELRRRL